MLVNLYATYHLLVIFNIKIFRIIFHIIIIEFKVKFFNYRH